MTQNTFSFSFQILDFEELNPKDQDLLEQARKASYRAYSPYSQYRVGAALLLENGTIVTGNNQENAAYPSGLCAERTAFFWAKSQFPDLKIVSLALSAKPSNEKKFVSVTPCGSCRQVMLEYEITQNQAIKLFLEGENGTVKLIENVASLLPLCFSNKDLG